MTRTYLLEETPIMVYPSLAAAAGMSAAAILQKIYFFQSHDRSGAERDGRIWVFHTSTAWVSQCFPWLSESQFRAIRDELRRAGLLLTRDDLSQERYKGTNKQNMLWYSVDAELLQQAMDLWVAAGKPKNGLCDLLKSRAENQQDLSAAENQQDLRESHAENQQDLGGGKGGDLSRSNQMIERTDDLILEKEKSAARLSSTKPTKKTFPDAIPFAEPARQNADQVEAPSAGVVFDGKAITGISQEVRAAWIAGYPLVNLDQAIQQATAWLINKKKPVGTEVSALMAYWLTDATTRATAPKQAKAPVLALVENPKPEQNSAPTENRSRAVMQALSAADLDRAKAEWTARRLGDEPGTPSGISSTQSWKWCNLISFSEYCSQHFKPEKQAVIAN